MAKPRDAKQGELREIKIVQQLEKLSSRPESRIDVQRFLEALSPTSQTYIRHLITSGPSSLLSAAKATGLSVKEIEASLEEIEKGIATLRGF